MTAVTTEPSSSSSRISESGVLAMPCAISSHDDTGDPFTRTILHVDFQELVAVERVSVKVPLVFHGTPEGVRVDGGMLDQVMHEVQIEADPSDIPNHIDVDVSAMQIATVLHVGDLQLPQGVTALDDAGLTVCTVQAPRVAEETVAEPTGDEPEVIRAKKTEEGAA